MVLGLLGLDQAEPDLLGRPRVVLGDLLGETVAKQVSRAVADVEQRYLTRADRRDHHRAAHPRPVGVIARGVENRGVRLLAGTLQAIDVRSLLPVL